MMAVTFLNMFRRGPGTYRDLTQDQDRDQMGICSDATSVELKPSTMEDGEVDGSFTLTQQNSNRKWCKIAKFAIVVIFFFIVGYLLGYVMPHKPDVSTSSVLSMAKPILLNTTTAVPDDDDGGNGNEESDEPTPRFADWSSITAALRQKLTHAALDETLINLSTSDHQAGSAGDHAMGQKVLEKFKGLGMNPWVDVHYVKLQAPSRENKVLIGSEEIANPMGYLSYSASGTKQGKVMYANYGRREDLENLQKEKMNLTDSIVLMRTGNISLAEKVANAARVGVAAVLIYREPKAESEVNTELYGQVHLGTGDPYTPGFPSFNHTQFPPASSSGLPKILAQTITAETARKIHQKMGGKNAPTDFMGTLPGVSKYTLGGETSITVTVKNDLVDTKIYNVFGIIKGFVDPDRYVVLGAQRDAFSHGFAKSTVGTSLLLELATAITGMVEDGFRPRRSIVFASWSGGDFGSIGSTEWLEGYLSSLNLRAFTYISLDSTVSGVTRFKASSSPLLYRLLKGTMDEVSSPRNRELSISQDFTISPWEKSVLEPMRMEDAAYPFLAFSGIPSVSFRFVSEVDSSDYTYFGTDLDTRDKLDAATRGNLLNVCESAAQMAGQMALRLVHDHILNLDVDEYTRTLRKNIAMIKKEINRVAPFNADASVLEVSWLFYAMGAYSRAASALQSEIKNSDLDVAETCRNINDRIMRVEHNLLSPYVSPKDVPFRHIIFGSGDYSVSALLDHLHSLSQQAEGSDADLFRNQFAFITWTIQSCANDLAGDIWILHND